MGELRSRNWYYRGFNPRQPHRTGFWFRTDRHSPPFERRIPCKTGNRPESRVHFGVWLHLIDGTGRCLPSALALAGN